MDVREPHQSAACQAGQPPTQVRALDRSQIWNSSDQGRCSNHWAAGQGISILVTLLA